MGADDLAEKLLAAADTASLASLAATDEYNVDEIARPATGQLATDEESLSRDLKRYVADAGEPTTE